MGSVPSINNRGFIIFIDCSNAVGVFRALLRHCDRAIKTGASLCVSDCGLSSPDAGVSLALSSSRN